jgi:hypothetical protein
LWFLPVAAVMLGLSLRALNADIPWKGDEDYHIARTLDIAQGFIMKAVTAKLAFLAMTDILLFIKNLI